MSQPYFSLSINFVTTIFTLFYFLTTKFFFWVTTIFSFCHHNIFFFLLVTTIFFFGGGVSTIFSFYSINLVTTILFSILYVTTIFSSFFLLFRHFNFANLIGYCSLCRVDYCKKICLRSCVTDIIIVDNQCLCDQGNLQRYTIKRTQDIFLIII